MKKLSTFYNPTATAYLKNNHPNSDNITVATGNQLGRDDMVETESEAKVKTIPEPAK